MAGPLPSAGPSSKEGSELDRLRRTVAAHFPIYETRLGPQSVTFAVHVDPATLEARFRTLADELWPEYYVPFLHQRTGEYFIEVGRRPTRTPGGILVNLILLVATVSSTVFTGALIWLSYVGGQTLTAPDFLWGGLYFALPLMAMLGCHELAHYVVARRYQLEASLPYFMPIPPPFLFGTLGAFISIRQPFTDRKALFDVGVAGPLAGFAIAVPVTLAGIYLSISAGTPSLAVCGPTFLGTSYSSLIIGLPPVWALGFDQLFPTSPVSLDPLALAGWVGIFVTAINLLPAGQLDGGHVFRALLGDRTRILSYAIALFLIAVGFVFYLGWLIFALLVVVLGLRHPPPLNDLSPLGWRRGLVGVAVAAILVTGFTLTPVATQTGQIGLSNHVGSAWLPPPPGYAVAGNLSVNIENLDPVVHGFLFTSSVVAVWSNATTRLNGSAFAAWAATTNWTFRLGTTVYVVNSTANASVPGGDGYYPVGGYGNVSPVVFFGNRQSAYEVEFALSVSEVCPPPGSGSATQMFGPIRF